MTSQPTSAVLPAAQPSSMPDDTPSERLARGGGWWTLLLALAALFAVSESLVAAHWTDGLEVVRYAMLGGALLAFLLSLTRWDGLFPVLYSFLASLMWIATLFHRYIFPTLSAQDSIQELLRRNGEWLSALLAGQASADSLIFVTQLALLGWWIGYLALWSLIRQHSLLQAVLPAGFALIVNAYFAQDGMTGFVILFMATALLLAIRIELARNETRWQLTRVRYAPDIALDFLKAGVIFAVVVIGLAWFVPSMAGSGLMERLLRPFETPWHQFQDTWQRMYRSLNPGRATTVVVAYGKTTQFGGPVSLTDRPIFEAETPERTYWRAETFDTYTGQGWINSDSTRLVIEAGTSLGEPIYTATRPITVTIFPRERGQTVIFGPPQIVRVSVPTDADATILPGILGARSVSLLHSRMNLDRQGDYTVVSTLSDATAERLRKAGASYPQWVRDRYLQLPAALPDRVLALAAEITAGRETPYDKAEAVQAALRLYRYDQGIAAPPTGADGVDYFLFDVKAGYCDYYASAMVVLLRAAGVPARFSVGYTAGQPQAQQERTETDVLRYRVVENNAHAWPEVFFPNYGWVQFEPTASEPLLVRPAEATEPGLTQGQPNQGGPNGAGGLDQPPNVGDTASAASQGAARGDWLARNWGWLAALALLAAGALRWQAARRRQATAIRDEATLGRLFERLGVWAARLHIHWPASDTPLEHAAQFGGAVPEAAPAAERIASLFVARQYGRQQPAPEALAEASTGWEALRPRLWRRWLGVLVRPPEKPQPSSGRPPGS